MVKICFFKFINLIVFFNLIYFSLEFEVTYIQKGESRLFYNIGYGSVIGLEVESIKKDKNVKISIKIANTQSFYKLNFNYKFFENYIYDTMAISFKSLSYSDLKTELDGTVIYTYSIYKDSNSFKYLLINLGCDISGEVTISFKQGPEKIINYIIGIIGIIIIILCIIGCCYCLIKYICEYCCCCCDDCSCNFNECCCCYDDCCCFCDACSCSYDYCCSFYDDFCCCFNFISFSYFRIINCIKKFIFNRCIRCANFYLSK